jgi:hypothetical protein
MNQDELNANLKGRVNQVFTVPNNEEGRLFIALAKKYLNKDSYEFKLRGRTPNKAKAKKAKVRLGSHSTPLDYSNNIGVYLMAKLTNGSQVVGIRDLIYSRFHQSRSYLADALTRDMEFINTQIQNAAKMSTQIIESRKQGGR